MSYSKQVWGDGIAGGTPINAASLNHMEAGIANADFLTCTSATRPTTGLFEGIRIYETDTKAFGFWDVSGWHMWDTVNQAFTPAINAAGGGFALNNGTTTGHYRRMGKLCWIRIYLIMGSTSSGGIGNIGIAIPAAIAARTDTGEQWIPGKMYTNGNSQNWPAMAYVASSGLSVWAPQAINVSSMGQIRSCDASGSVTTGIPQVSGNYSLYQGSNLIVEGTYEMNVG